MLVLFQIILDITTIRFWKETRFIFSTSDGLYIADYRKTNFCVKISKCKGNWPTYTNFELTLDQKYLVARTHDQSLLVASDNNQGVFELMKSGLKTFSTIKHIKRRKANEFLIICEKNIYFLDLNSSEIKLKYIKSGKVSLS